MAAIALALVLGAGGTARAAFTPPPLTHLVTDTSGHLSAEDLAFLNDRLGAFRTRSAHAIVVLVTDSLQGENIDDAAYTTFNTWKVGERGKDDGVLLLIAPSERKVRIETGKGVGGDLTDLQANDIIRRLIGPRLKENQFREAIQAGTDAIAQALSPADAPSPTASPTATPTPVVPGRPYPLRFNFNFCVCPIVLLFLLSRFFFRRRRGIFWGGGGGWGGGGWGGGGFGGGGGGFGGGDGGGYSGGGGESGGGGSSDSY